MSAIRCLCDPTTRRGHEYNEWIGYWFSQCVYTTSDYIGFVFGLINLAVWTYIYFPQLYRSYKSKGKGLSPVMLSVWVLGDMCGLLGLLLTGQRGLILVNQFYFTSMDLILFLQCMYYTAYLKQTNEHDDTINSLKEKQHNIQSIHSETELTSLDDLGSTNITTNYNDNNNNNNHNNNITQNTFTIEPPQEDPFNLPSPLTPIANQENVTPSTTTMTSTTINTTPTNSQQQHHVSVSTLNVSNNMSTIIALSLCILSLASSIDAFTITKPLQQLSTTLIPSSTITTTAMSTLTSTFHTVQESVIIPLCTGNGTLAQWQKTIGIICAFICCAIYSPSRLPQIIYNYKRKSTYGLSKTFIGLAVLAAFLYGGQILIPSSTYDRTDGYTTRTFWLQTFPYVLSTIIGLTLNSIICFQIWLYCDQTQADGIGVDIPDAIVEAQEEYDLNVNSNLLLFGEGVPQTVIKSESNIQS